MVAAPVATLRGGRERPWDSSPLKPLWQTCRTRGGGRGGRGWWEWLLLGTSWLLNNSKGEPTGHSQPLASGVGALEPHPPATLGGGGIWEWENCTSNHLGSGNVGVAVARGGWATVIPPGGRRATGCPFKKSATGPKTAFTRGSFAPELMAPCPG